MGDKKIEKKHKHHRAMELLALELNKLGGIVFARWLANTNEETKESVEASEFLAQLMKGKIADKDKDFLLPYLEPMWEINLAIKVLEADNSLPPHTKE